MFVNRDEPKCRLDVKHLQKVALFVFPVEKRSVNSVR